MLRICWVGYAMDRRRFDGQRNDMQSEGIAWNRSEKQSEGKAKNCAETERHGNDMRRNGKATNCLVTEKRRLVKRRH